MSLPLTPGAAELKDLQALILTAIDDNTKVDKAFTTATDADAAAAAAAAASAAASAAPSGSAAAPAAAPAHWTAFTAALTTANSSLAAAKAKYEEYKTAITPAAAAAAPATAVTKKYNVVVPQDVTKQYNEFMTILTEATVNTGSTTTAGIKVVYNDFAQKVADAFNNAVSSSSSGGASSELKASLTDQGTCIITDVRIYNATVVKTSGASTDTNSFTTFLAYIRSNSLRSEASLLAAVAPATSSSPSPSVMSRGNSNVTIDPRLYLSVIAALAYDSILPIIEDYLKNNSLAAGFIQPSSSSSASSSSSSSSSSSAIPATAAATPVDLTISTLEKFIEQINAIFLKANNARAKLDELIAQKYDSQTGGGGGGSTSYSKKNRKSHTASRPRSRRTRKHSSSSSSSSSSHHKKMKFVHHS